MIYIFHEQLEAWEEKAATRFGGDLNGKWGQVYKWSKGIKLSGLKW